MSHICNQKECNVATKKKAVKKTTKKTTKKTEKTNSDHVNLKGDHCRKGPRLSVTKKAMIIAEIIKQETLMKTPAQIEKHICEKYKVSTSKYRSTYAKAAAEHITAEMFASDDIVKAREKVKYRLLNAISQVYNDYLERNNSQLFQCFLSAIKQYSELFPNALRPHDESEQIVNINFVDVTKKK